MDEEISRDISLPQAPESVWRALTAADQLSAWFGAEAEIDARPGGRATFRWPDGRSRDAVVEAAEAPRLLVLRWLPFERDVAGRPRQVAAGRIRFVLRPSGAGARLTVSETRPRLEHSLQASLMTSPG